MIHIDFAKETDKDFWYSLDKHLPESEFLKKVRDRQGYVLFENNTPVGILRYNMFWDNIPFCTMLYIENMYQKKGYGRALMQHWENDMRKCGYGMVLVSTRVDEEAQHFYRKIGYVDCGCLIIDIPGYEQPAELFMAKQL